MPRPRTHARAPSGAGTGSGDSSRASGAPVVVAFAERMRALERELEGALTAGRGRGLRARLEEAADELLDPGELAQAFYRLRGDAERRLEPAMGESLERLLAFLYRRWFRVQVEGIAHVPGRGPALLICEAPEGLVAYEPAMLRMALRLDHPTPRPLRVVMASTLRRRRLARPLLERLGGLVARRDIVARALGRGEALAVFSAAIGDPDAARIAIARELFLDAALEAGATVVPVASLGGAGAHPVLGTIPAPTRLLGLPDLPVTPTFPWLGLLGLVPLPARWRIRFGEPLAIGEAPNDARRAAELAEEIQRRLRSLRQEMRRGRRTSDL